jgi:hypothetical protein
MNLYDRAPEAYYAPDQQLCGQGAGSVCRSKVGQFDISAPMSRTQGGTSRTFLIGTKWCL